MKNIKSVLFIILFFIIILAMPSYAAAKAVQLAQDSVSEAETVDYDLPFSGMLPDSPFYIIKKARDHIHIFFTRDHIRKAELLLNVADKKASMAKQLADKNKWDLVVETLQDSQSDCEQMLFSMETGQKIGTSPSPELVVIAQTSNEKRDEIMKNLLDDAPEEYQESIEEIIKKNVEHYNRLDRL